MIRKLKYKYFTLLLIILIVVFSGFGVVFNMKISKTLKEITLSELAKDAEIISTDINTYFTKYKEIVLQMETNDSLIEFIRNAEKGDNKRNNSDFDSIVNTLKKIKETDDNISLVWLGIIDYNDLVTDKYDWDANDSYQIEERPWFKEMISNGIDMTFTQPYIDSITGEMVISMIIPIFYDSKLIGNIGIDIKIEDLNEYLKNYKIGETGFPIMVTDKGSVLYIREQIDSISFEYISNFQEKLMNSNMAENSYYECKDIDKYCVYKKIKVNNWNIGTFISKKEIDDKNKLINTMSIIIFFSSTLILLIMALMTKLRDKYSNLENLYKKLSEQERELLESHNEMSAAYQQLTASEEELRAQYDEIQNYVLAIERLKQKYEIAIKGTDSVIWEIDLKNENMFLSKDLFKTVKKGTYLLDDIIEKLLKKEDQKIIREKLEEINCNIESEFYMEMPIIDYFSTEKWIMMQGKRLKDESVINGILLDITDIKERELYVKNLSEKDDLTQLPNRRKFIFELEKEIDSVTYGAVALLDLDNFKSVNDTLGHVFGDKVLIKIGQLLKKIESDQIMVSRFGGDEFLILIKNVREIKAIENIIKNMVNLFEQKIQIDSNEIYISCSVGITVFPFDGSTSNKLISNADVAMYRVKNSGKNNYKFFNDQMTLYLEKQLDLEFKLRDAIENDGFKLVYQPQVNVKTGYINGFEALLRFKDLDISPGEFIPIAEETGLIIKIGRWVFESLCRFINKITLMNKEIKRFSFNFSAKQMNDKNFINFVSETIKKYKIDPMYLEIEITESIFINNKDETINFLNEIRKLGISIALDDFGTGYSSLSYLTFLPVDIVKLDKEICQEFLGKDNGIVMRELIGLSHSLKLKVIAEGIENIDQFNKLEESNCDYIQGYLFSKPVSEAEVTKVYDKNMIDKIKL